MWVCLIHFKKWGLHEPTVAYLPEERTMKPEKQPLLDNDCVTRDNGVTVASGVFFALRGCITRTRYHYVRVLRRYLEE
jgi:hypothetical protein